MARKLTILMVGKTKEKWLLEALQIYETRLRSKLSIDTIPVKTDEELISRVQDQKGVFLLDPRGKMLTSEAFSEIFLKAFEENGTELCFVIGGPEGLPPSIKEKYQAISLSSLTLTHQMVRLLLVEQVYRAFEIEKGSPYHK